MRLGLSATSGEAQSDFGASGFLSRLLFHASTSRGEDSNAAWRSGLEGALVQRHHVGFGARSGVEQPATVFHGLFGQRRDHLARDAESAEPVRDANLFEQP